MTGRKGIQGAEPGTGSSRLSPSRLLWRGAGGRGAGSSSRYGEALGKPWLSPGRARGEQRAGDTPPPTGTALRHGPQPGGPALTGTGGPQRCTRVPRFWQLRPPCRGRGMHCNKGIEIPERSRPRPHFDLPTDAPWRGRGGGGRAQPRHWCRGGSSQASSRGFFCLNSRLALTLQAVCPLPRQEQKELGSSGAVGCPEGQWWSLPVSSSTSEKTWAGGEHSELGAAPGVCHRPEGHSGRGFQGRMVSL